METGNETALIVRPEEAEYVALPHGGGFRLLADAAELLAVLTPGIDRFGYFSGHWAASSTA
ncbi:MULTISPECIES: hypothetical protein [unclassified Streptomyces]|uniref:hypothetical protein n=1 Tax=unclassified Streptomyces TaxID=2593676 RepID=UPI002254326B|nr:hypothetical protein [Streptomyces sp. NBC_00047]MCX5610179.1 hypothetical protein [Streptomyces sp. NBC_00047]